jgi:putative DNA primase/helicase
MSNSVKTPRVNKIKQPDPVLFESNLTDTGNAECLIAFHGDQLRHCRHTKQWMHWDGVRWRPDADPIANRFVINIARQRAIAAPWHDKPEAALRWAKQSENASKVESTLRIAKNLEPITTVIEDYDTDPMLLACKNVYINLTSGQSMQPDPTLHITKQAGCKYDPTATCPRWLQFLQEVFVEHEVIQYIQRCVGYLLTGDMREQKIWFCHGSGANGKTIFYKTIIAMLGEYAQIADFVTFDADRRSDKTNDLAALRGARFIAISEINENKSLDEARIKSVTGLDEIRCRFLHSNEFVYKPTFKIWIMLNHLPRIRGTDNGIWRRIQVIPFTQTFEGAQDDKTLLETLQGSELSGILNWALEGLREWRSQGLNPPQSIVAITAVYRGDSDLLGQFLDEECLTDDPTGYTLTVDFYQAYTVWLSNRGERFPPKKNAIDREMTMRGYQRCDKYLPTKKRAYQGVILITPLGGLP